MLMFRKAALFLCMTLCFICNAMAQSYDDNFEKPIVSEDGKFRYYELPAIKTTEGELIFLDRNLGATSGYVGTTDSWG
ncbi:MAG: hypothetical protein UHN59_07415, partial [Bacteroidales bacterium]|nr:hypothetical protein [Bacteroidales bacterium]